jgi:hypothetical protein
MGKYEITPGGRLDRSIKKVKSTTKTATEATLSAGGGAIAGMAGAVNSALVDQHPNGAGVAGAIAGAIAGASAYAGYRGGKAAAREEQLKKLGRQFRK